MHSKQGVELYFKAIEEAKKLGGKIEYGAKVCKRSPPPPQRLLYTHLAIYVLQNYFLLHFNFNSFKFLKL